MFSKKGHFQKIQENVGCYNDLVMDTVIILHLRRKFHASGTVSFACMETTFDQVVEEQK